MASRLLTLVIAALACVVAGCGGRSTDQAPAASGGGSKAPAVGDALSMTFEVLSCFTVPEPGEPMTPIPPEIRDLDGRRIAIRGFVVPVDQEAEGTNRFVLLNCALACCYGKMPKPNEWIDVTVKGGERISLAIDQPAWAFGRLEVREEIEDGTLVGLYWMEADEVRIDTAS